MIDEKKLIEDLNKCAREMWLQVCNPEMYGSGFYTGITTALDIIGAQPKISLENKPSDNRKLIDADDLLKAMDELNHSLQGARYYFAHIENWIRSQPKLDVPDNNVGKWIPVTERLPEENGSYIVTSMDYVDTFEAVFDAGEWFSIDYCDDIKNVIAWMPLPESYKGEE